MKLKNITLSQQTKLQITYMIEWNANHDIEFPTQYENGFDSNVYVNFFTIAQDLYVI